MAYIRIVCSRLHYEAWWEFKVNPTLRIIKGLAMKLHGFKITYLGLYKGDLEWIIYKNVLGSGNVNYPSVK